MSELGPRDISEIDIDEAIEANRDRITASVEAGEAAKAAGVVLPSLDEVIEESRLPKTE